MIKSHSNFGTGGRMAWFNAYMPQRCLHVTTIPAMLALFNGNITKVAEQLGTHRSTVTKYRDDQDASRHAIVNGTLFTKGKLAKKGADNETNLVRS